METPKKIVIVEDHLLFAQCLQHLLHELEDYQVHTILKNGKELIDYFGEGNLIPDLILLDIKMPVMDGVQTMEWLQTNYPKQKVLVLTMEDDEETISKIICAGARGYILKEIHPKNFKIAIDTILEGEYFDPNLVDRDVMTPHEEKVYQNPTPFFDQLSAIEWDYTRIFCTALSYQEIAKIQSVSTTTIENYRKRIFKKFGVKTRTSLIIFCAKNNLFSKLKKV